MAITTIKDSTLSRALGRLRLMARFPGSDPDLLTALCGELADICRVDSEVDALIAEVISGYEIWPGIHQLRDTAHRLRNEREAKEQRQRNWAACHAHEAFCPGYALHVNEAQCTIAVDFCKEEFGTDAGGGWMAQETLICRCGEQLRAGEPGFCDRLLAVELDKRPGFVSVTEFIRREHEEFNRRWKSGAGNQQRGTQIV